MGGSKPNAKSFEIPKRLVYEAWEKVRVHAWCSAVGLHLPQKFPSSLSRRGR